MNYLIMIFAALLIGLLATLYFVDRNVSPPTPHACLQAGGQIVMKPGNKFKCDMPKEWWRF